MGINMLAAEGQAAGILGAGLAIAGIALATAFIVFGAARGISNIAGKAVESIARQPEAGGSIFTTTVVTSALIEGFTFFAIVVCLLSMGNLESLIKLFLGIT